MEAFGDDEFSAFSETMDKLGVRDYGVPTVYIDPEDNEASLDQRDHIIVCEVCEKQLNRFTTPDHTEMWVHTHIWQRYDHEPVPVKRPKDTPRVTLCDFCGLEGVNTWVFAGDRMRSVSGNLNHDYGTNWGACAQCSVLVNDRDLNGLIDRVIRVGPVSRKLRRTVDIGHMRDQLANLHGPFLNSIVSKRYIGPPIVPTRLHPRLMPKLRTGLLKFWRNNALYERIGAKEHFTNVPGLAAGDDTVFRRSYEPGEQIPRTVLHEHTRHIATGIEVAEMYWISKDFTTLATVAGQDLTDIELSREQLPADYGFLIWETPVGEIERTYGVAGIRAISWTLVSGGVWLNVYVQGEDADPDCNITEMRAEHGWLISPNCGSGLPFDVLMAREPTPKANLAVAETNFVYTLLATWFLMQQPGVAEQRTAPKDKALARAYQRNHGKPLPDVRLVDLRRHAVARTEPESDAERRRLSVRFMVRGHWKRQAYGPKRGLRRTIYIAPFMKGPDGAPLKVDTPATVKVLR